MKNMKINKSGLTNLIIGASLALVGAGCAGTSNVSYREQPRQTQESREEIYSSPVIKSEYGFEVVSRSGNVDVSNSLFEKDGKLYVVGFGTASTHRGMAEHSAWINAASTALRRLYAPKVTSKKTEDREERTETINRSLYEFFCPQRNFIKVRDKNGNLGEIVETLCETPLSNYPNQIGSHPPRKGGDLGLPAPVIISRLPKPTKGGNIDLPAPVIISRIPYEKPVARETEAQKVKREIREYIQRNKINLSVLEKGERPTGIYSLGNDNENKVLVTSYASPIVKNLDKKLNVLARNSDIEEIAKDTVDVIKYLDRGCDDKGCVGKTDRMIIGREAKKANKLLDNYLQSKINKKNGNKRK